MKRARMQLLLILLATATACNEGQRSIGAEPQMSSGAEIPVDDAEPLKRSEPQGTRSVAEQMRLDSDTVDAETRRFASAACANGERAIFACTIERGRPLAVCATPDGRGEYRYGGSKPELVLEGHSWAVDRFARGGESQIRFVNGDVSYTVFSRLVATSVEDGGTGPSISDGVVIERGENLVAIRFCEGRQANLPIQYDLAEKVFGDRQELFTGASAEADEVE